MNSRFLKIFHSFMFYFNLLHFLLYTYLIIGGNTDDRLIFASIFHGFGLMWFNHRLSISDSAQKTDSKDE